MKTKFYGTAAVSYIDPTIARMRFVFTDFLPNANKQAIASDEADNIITSGKYKPVKISFAGKKPGNHEFSVPIGPITDIYLSEDKIIAEAIVWRDEYPEVCAYLEENHGINFSWELYYSAVEQVDGVDWLKDCIVAGVAIVDKPAYKGRTPLLALAEEVIMEEELKEEVVQDLQPQIDALTAELAAAKETIEKYSQELNELRVERQIAARRESFVKRGLSSEVFDRLSPAILSIDNEAFDDLVEVLASVAGSGKSEKSAQAAIVIPEPASRIASTTEEEIGLNGVVELLRQLKKV